jgi:uncharacterized MAPEG superfamily protein
MTYETALLTFGLITLAVLGTEIMFTYATKGFGFGFSSNRPNTEFSPFAKRLKNSYQNQVECAAYAVPILLAAALLLTDSTSGGIASACFVIGRGLYVVLYWTGAPFIRVPAFLLAQMSLLYIVYLVLMGQSHAA